jgi:hypothetical protein
MALKDYILLIKKNKPVLLAVGMTVLLVPALITYWLYSWLGESAVTWLTLWSVIFMEGVRFFVGRSADFKAGVAKSLSKVFAAQGYMLSCRICSIVVTIGLLYAGWWMCAVLTLVVWYQFESLVKAASKPADGVTF